VGALLEVGTVGSEIGDVEATAGGVTVCPRPRTAEEIAEGTEEMA